MNSSPAEGNDAITVRHEGPVTLIGINRPQVRNAVNGPAAQALTSAFTDFGDNPESSVAILYGEGGTFCAGADLKAIGTADGNRAEAAGPGPMGPTRMRLAKPVIAAISGHASLAG